MKIILLTLVICSLIVIPLGFTYGAYTLEMDYPVIQGETPGGGLANYVRYMFVFALGMVALAAFGALVYGGFLYMLSGAVGAQEEAKKWIYGAISGLILGSASYLILRTINPDLVSLRLPQLPQITLPQTPAAQPQTLNTQKAGDPCTPNQPPLCDTYQGLECKNGVCVVSQQRQQQQLSGLFFWLPQADCLFMPACADDSFCAGDKQSDQHCCCRNPGGGQLGGGASGGAGATGGF